jgi:hypothetical protein
MGDNKCDIQLRQGFMLSQKQYAQIMDDFRQIMEESGRTGKPPTDVVSQVLRKKIVDIKTTRNVALKTQEIFERNANFVDQEAFKGNELDALYVLLEPKVKYKYEGSTGSVFTKKKAIADKVQAFIDGEVNKHKGAMKRLVSGEMDRDLFKAVIDEDLTGLDSATVSISKAIRKSNDFLYNLKRMAGFETNYLENYLIKQVHHPSAMFKLGEQQWTKLALNTFDFDKMTFPSLEARDEWLSKFYASRVKEIKQIRGGKVEASSMKRVTANRPANLFASSRSVHFKDGDSAFNYFKSLNKDATLYQTLIHGIDSDSGKIANGEVFGPNYYAGYQSIKAKIKDKMFEARGEEGAKQFAQKERFFDEAFKTLSQNQFQGEMNSISILADSARKITDMSKLPTALPTTITDFAFAGAIVSRMTGKSYARTIFDLSVDTFKNFVSPEVRKSAAARLGYFSNDVNAHTMHTRYGDYGVAKNWLDRTHSFFMRGTGLANQAVSMKLAISKQISMAIADFADHSFDQMPMAESMKRFGIDEKRWNLIRKSVQDAESGSVLGGVDTIKVISPQTIMDLDDSLFKNMDEKGIMHEKIRMSNAIQEMVTFFADRGSPTTGMKDYVLKNMFDRNTWQGQLIRSMMQYKSFAISVYDSMDTIRWNNSTGKYGNLQDLALTAVVGSGFGALALASKDILMGYDPTERMKDKKEWDVAGYMGETLLQSGVLGILGDVAFSDYGQPYRNLPSTIAGPMISGIGQDSVKLFSEIFHTDWEKAPERQKYLRNALITAEKNAPGLFMTKQLINQNMFNVIHSYLNTNRKPPRRRSFWEYQKMKGLLD